MPKKHDESITKQNMEDQKQESREEVESYLNWLDSVLAEKPDRAEEYTRPNEHNDSLDKEDVPAFIEDTNAQTVRRAAEYKLAKQNQRSTSPQIMEPVFPENETDRSPEISKSKVKTGNRNVYRSTQAALWPKKGRPFVDKEKEEKEAKVYEIMKNDKQRRKVYDHRLKKGKIDPEKELEVYKIMQNEKKLMQNEKKRQQEEPGSQETHKKKQRS